MITDSPPRPIRCLNQISSLALLLTVVGLPLLGAAWRGATLATFFRFPPPLEIPGDYPHFSWYAASAIVLVLAAVAASWMRSGRLSNSSLAASVNPTKSSGGHRSPFPWWGGAALSWTLCWWVVAWTRLAPLEGIQPYTFFPLWIGFIVVVNALVQSRTGTCLMLRSPKRWLVLFAASAFFWWIFEWLNRFVQNWHYLGVAKVGPVEYAVHATLCFSTVLPAVAAVAESLASSSNWTRLTQTGPSWAWFERRGTATILLCAGAGALFLTGVYPQRFYPALWAAPLAMVLGQSVLTRRGGVAHEIASGHRHRAATWMAAALLCGFFWELWNSQSFAHWIYTVPGVDRWHVFEMPLLGYTGYLPFGLECLLVVERLGGLADQ